jgi:outer membrane protein assembly factor BamA
MTKARLDLAPLLAFALALTACGASPSVVPAPKAAAPIAKPPPPPCPDTIVAGGDPLESAAFEGKPVVRVCVVGGTEESRKNAQRAIDLRPSDIFSAERVRADLEAIFELGAFDDAAAYGLRVHQGNAIVLLYSVHDRPRIAQIGFEGAKVLRDAALNAKLPFEAESRYDPAKVNVIAQAVRDEYRQRGYGTARVTLVAEPTNAARDHVRVRIQVEEGPLWHFTKIDFKGNKKLSAVELRKTAGLEVGKPVVDDEIERAGLVLSALYYDRGFVQVRVDPEVDLQSITADGGVAMAFTIDEGDVYSIGSMHATKLGEPFEKELLSKVISARPKQVFSRSAIVKDIERVKAFFAAKKQDVQVNPLTEIDAKKKTIDLTFQIEGP